MISPTLTLPSWAAPTTSLMKTTATQNYACSIMGGVGRSLALTLDPYYYGFTYCSCDPGLYSIPPNCLSIPYVVNPQNITSAAQLLNLNTYAVSDSLFGNSRKITGLETSWVLHHRYTPYNATLTNNDPRLMWLSEYTSPSVLTHAIYIWFNFSDTEFTSFTDVISVFEGGQSLTGERAVIYRGSDHILAMSGQGPQIGNLPPGVIPPAGPAGALLTTDQLKTVVVVFSQTATLQFSSRAAGGNPFSALYWFSPHCPDGYALAPKIVTVANTNTQRVEEQCTIVRPVYDIGTALQAGIYLLASVTMAVVLVVMFVIFKYRKSILIRAASREFCFAMLSFLLVTALGSIFHVMSPSGGDAVCSSRWWLLCIGLIGTLGCLLAKTERIRKIFTSEQISRDVLTNRDLLIWVCGLLLIELVFLISFSAAKLTHAAREQGTGTLSENDVWVCTTSASGYNIWLGLQFGYAGLFVIWGSYVAFQTKSVPDAYNESGYITACLFVILFFAIILTPLQYLVEDSPRALGLIRGVGQSLLALLLTLILFGPKLFYIWIGRENDRAMVATATPAQNTSTKGSRQPAHGTGAAGSSTGGSGGGGGGGSAGNSRASLAPQLSTNNLKSSSQIDSPTAAAGGNNSRVEAIPLADAGKQPSSSALPVTSPRASTASPRGPPPPVPPPNKRGSTASAYGTRGSVPPPPPPIENSATLPFGESVLSVGSPEVTIAADDS